MCLASLSPLEITEPKIQPESRRIVPLRATVKPHYTFVTVAYQGKSNKFTLIVILWCPINQILTVEPSLSRCGTCKYKRGKAEKKFVLLQAFVTSHK